MFATLVSLFLLFISCPCWATSISADGNNDCDDFPKFNSSKWRHFVNEIKLSNDDDYYRTYNLAVELPRTLEDYLPKSCLMGDNNSSSSSKFDIQAILMGGYWRLELNRTAHCEYRSVK